MRQEYDFEKMKGRQNPYAKNLINLYLRDCVQTNRKPSLNWTQ